MEEVNSSGQVKPVPLRPVGASQWPDLSQGSRKAYTCKLQSDKRMMLYS